MHIERTELEAHLGIKLPELKDVRSMLRNNAHASTREKVLKAYVIGSIARKTNKDGSDLDIAVIIPRKVRKTSLRFTEYYHERFLSNNHKPHWKGVRVDFQFFYPEESVQIEQWAHMVI